MIARSGQAGRAEGSYFGWWNFAIKLNLALAAGRGTAAARNARLHDGARDAAALDALTWAYCLLPCALKLVAAGLLWGLWMRSPHAEEGR